MSEPRILVVEDDADQRELVAGLLRGRGHAVSEAGSLAEGRAALAAGAVDLVLCDWQLGDGTGMELLSELGDDPARPAFVVVTAYGTIGRAVESIRAGADDYLTKPFEGQALLLAVEKALRAWRLQVENRRLSEEVADRDRLVDILGRAPAMQRLFRRLEKIADTGATVLIGGESGTGKELGARALHSLSRRSEGPFVAVNCAAIPEGLVESELFGAERGAFTGADRRRAGKLESADGGTLFLDEVGELPLAIQPKLLRALQESRFPRVGGTEEVEVDVRVVAATNRDLSTEVAEGRFREDLYYRLAVVPLEMPPLRERREDLPLLVEHFVERASRRHGIVVEPLAPSLRRVLLDHSWPGNVRELGNVIERLVLLAEDGHLSAEDLPREIVEPSPGASGFRLPGGGMSWESHERDCLAQALERTGGNRAAAARLLDLPYKAFLYRLEKHGLGGA